MPEDRGRIQERRERVEHLGVRWLAGHLHNRTEGRKRDLARAFPVEREQPQLRIRIVQVAHHECVVHDLRAFDHVARLRHDFLPPGLCGMPDIDGDDATARRPVVGLEEKRWAAVSDESIGCVERIEQSLDWRIDARVIGVAEVLIVDPVAAIGAEPHAVDSVTPVGADLDAETPIGLVGALINQPVGRLLGAELVVVDLLVAIDLE